MKKALKGIEIIGKNDFVNSIESNQDVSILCSKRWAKRMVVKAML
ncbi:MAG: hypothetical protein P9M07_07515 [Candidatus Aceula meridiana]|nr:hypothetical protein [Candidatus Aceula meridiana]